MGANYKLQYNNVFIRRSSLGCFTTALNELKIVKSFRRIFILQEASNIIEAVRERGIDVKELYCAQIAPPECSCVFTDEDSGDEDAGGLVYNLIGKQLSADKEIRFPPTMGLNN